jgi:acyl-[acyl-carrier-protein]-phospholipid O-acyltransferase/long-chain-fatty-acid--[acyl-carrier-protein] ligase
MRTSLSWLERVLRSTALFLGRCLYRVRTHGASHLPAGGFLLLPNHLTWIDSIVLQIACPRPIRFIVYDEIYQLPLLKPVFQAVQAIPISPRHAKEAVRVAAERIAAGEIVCIFPEGELSRSGILLRLKRGYELIARTANCPVVPVWMDQLWGSIFSFEGGRFFFKMPKRIPYPVTVAFGEPIPPAEADIATVRQALLELGEFCYQQRPELRGHLGRACLRGLRSHQFAPALIDGIDGSTISRGSLLAAGITLSRELRRLCPQRRLAIVLPPGKGAVIANLAVVLAGKVPVNLNFTAGRDAVSAAMRIAQIEHCLTARLMAKRLADFPWPQQIHYLDELLPPLRARMIAWRAVVAILPSAFLGRLLHLPRVGDRDEAVLLFTSGSAGEPKGVVLSHRNLIGNVSQFALMLSLTPRDSLLACLPFFHSFGCTVTLWYPLIEGVRAVTHPNALEIGKHVELIERHRITLLCSTPTFLRGYLRKADVAQLESLDLIVTGAEKLPMDLADAFRERFGKEVLQGYGLTETAPVASVNLPEPRLPAATTPSAAPAPSAADAKSEARREPSVQPSSRRGSVGKLAPGMAAQIRNPENDSRLSLHDSGMLWLRGPNIFEGYLDDPVRTTEVLRDGWFKTGDLGRFDEDGFLYIEGRLSRFSKIGGEMVPHETIEAKIGELLQLPKDERLIAVTGIPDEAKGEALVLLAARDLDLRELREKLTAAGVPNLWIPKKLQRVDAIPVLASGKLDLRRCRELAAQ